MMKKDWNSTALADKQCDEQCDQQCDQQRDQQYDYGSNIRWCDMQALGVAVELSPASVTACIEQTRLGFMYAPYYHPVMKSVKSVRSALQVLCRSIRM